ncbi:uncharacterized protein A4U43_UnF10550 [Asparagus officinalis]|uniref:Uncharacterized protein n=1 Tax=Asparagus officinalis TaxID=4686 RepID=A0A1R3L5G5_ASPOF|nr:uncharacterized protein A4U43_UnF10550 [Asparagus officinalis]
MAYPHCAAPDQSHSPPLWPPTIAVTQLTLPDETPSAAVVDHSLLALNSTTSFPASSPTASRRSAPPRHALIPTPPPPSYRSGSTLPGRCSSHATPLLSSSSILGHRSKPTSSSIFSTLSTPAATAPPSSDSNFSRLRSRTRQQPHPHRDAPYVTTSSLLF